MTKLLEQAFAEVSKLPAEEHGAFEARIMAKAKAKGLVWSHLHPTWKRGTRL